MNRCKDNDKKFVKKKKKTSYSTISPGSYAFVSSRENIHKKKNKQSPHILENKDTENIQQQTQDTTTGVSKNPDLKTIIIWIYNINQNGSANSFHEELSQYMNKDDDGNVHLRDLDQESMSELLSSLSTSKEIVLKELGVRLLLFIINCNQNGSSNNTEIAYQNAL